MLFTDKIKQLREERQLPQRQLAATLEVDTATYCKIERGDRKARREQVIMLAQLLGVDYEELMSLWLADQVTAIVSNEKGIAHKVFSIANNQIENEINKDENGI